MYICYVKINFKGDTMRSIKMFIIYSIFTTSIFAFDGVSIGYDGSQFQSATFHNNQLIYGLDFLHANVTTEVVDEYCTDYDYYGNCNYYSTKTEDFSVSINVFMPRIGYKMAGPSSGKINTYNQIEAYLVFPLVSIDIGEGGDTDEIEEVIEDIVDVMGFKFSKIIQYNFNDQLSLMAHVGFNLTIGNIDNDQVEEAINGRLGMTYTQLSLKFNL